jgi:hypothetical protein
MGIIPDMNWHTFLADVVVFVHLAYVLFVIVCVPLILLGGWLKWSWVRNFWFRTIHFLMMGVVVVETVFGVTCPLTTWESQLRLAGGQYDYQRDEAGNMVTTNDGYVQLAKTESYQQDFVGRCLQAVLFFDPTQVPQWVLNLCYYIFGGLVLMTLLLVRPRWPKKKPQVLKS